MTIHHAAGGSEAGLAGSLPGFRSFASGSWKILATPHYVEVARSFLAPLPVESLLAAFERVDVGEDGPEASREAHASPGAAPEVGETGDAGRRRVSTRDGLIGSRAEDPRSGVGESAGSTLGDAGDSGAKADARSPAPPRGRMATLEVDCGEGSTLVVKALRRGGLPARLRGGYHGSSRLFAEMAILAEAIRREVPTARLAFGATGRRENGSEVAILATERIHGAVRLGDLLSDAVLPPEPAAAPARRRTDAGGPSRGPEAAPTDGRDVTAARKEDPRAAGVPELVPPRGDDRRVPAAWETTLARRQAIRAAGAAVGKAHELGLDHADLNLGNILVRSEGGAWSGFVIDLGLSALGSSLGVRRRAANLVRLLRSIEKHLGSDPRRARDAAAFLQGYLSTTPAPRRRRRRALLAAVRRGLPSILVHRLGWSLLGRRSKQS